MKINSRNLIILMTLFSFGCEADDQVGLQRLTEYIVRCPFSLARMVKVTDDGKVIYRSGKSNCLRFPEHRDEQLKAGTSRNFQVFEPLEFLA